MSYALQLLDSLPDPFQGKPNIAALLMAYAEQFDHLSRTISEVDFYRDVATADRTRLLMLANLVGETSRSENDVTLRASIIGRAFVNSSDGSLNHVKKLHKILYPLASEEAVFKLMPPKHLRIVQNWAESMFDTSEQMSVLREVTIVNANMIRDCCDPGTSVTILLINDGTITTSYPTYEFPIVRATDYYPTSFLEGAFPIGFNSNDDR